MWYFENKPITELPEGFASFVYRITNNVTGKQYIGKKKFHTYQRKKVKGRKNRKKIVKESDWKTYYGSNEELKQDIEELGVDKFHREILDFCKTTGQASYTEAKYQFQFGVLENPELWYNSWIQCKVHRTHLKK